MDNKQRFFEALKCEMTVILATAAGKSVSMRAVSPVLYEGKMLFFTAPGSKKYEQLRENPNCCVCAGGIFAEAEAEFCGSVTLSENEALRAAYSEKFTDAFDENAEFGAAGNDFILLKPHRIYGWEFENGIPTAPFDESI